MGSIQDNIESAERDRERKARIEYGKLHGPPLLQKVNQLLQYSHVYDSRIEQKREELRNAVIVWMYEQGALSEK